VVSRPFVTSTIIGATTLEQLKSDMAAAELTLPDNVLEDIEQIHLDYPNPCP
jgi:aryl-alcohol dehydrogenase-like predicted oxidoreductase